MSPLRSVSVRYAVRSLLRNRRRTLLSIVGVAFGVGVGLVALSWVGGGEGMSINAAAGGGIGHLRVAPEGWVERRAIEMRLPEWEATLARVRATDGVAVAAPHARVGGLLGMGTRSAHVPLTGVDAAAEPQALRYVRELDEGRYLEPGERSAIVIGRTLAQRLRVEVDDELVVTVVDDEGEIESALLVVVGIAATGSRSIDATIAHVALADVERLSGREGANDITILLDDPNAVEPMQRAIAAQVPDGAEALTWLDVSPELRANLESDGVFMNIAVGIILLVVLLGVASAQLTGVLERRKEFAVLAAVGMRGFALVRVVLAEGALLGVLGALAALAWSTPILHAWSTNGVDLSAAWATEDGGMAFGGVLMDPMYYPIFGPWVLWTALGLSLIATIVASLYPAWFASRTDPASALRVDR